MAQAQESPKSLERLRKKQTNPNKRHLSKKANSVQVEISKSAVRLVPLASLQELLQAEVFPITFSGSLESCAEPFHYFNQYSRYFSGLTCPLLGAIGGFSSPAMPGTEAVTLLPFFFWQRLHHVSLISLIKVICHDLPFFSKRRLPPWKEPTFSERSPRPQSQSQLDMPASSISADIRPPPRCQPKLLHLARRTWPYIPNALGLRQCTEQKQTLRIQAQHL